MAFSLREETTLINNCKRTYKADGHNINRVDAEIYYDKGGWSYMTGKERPRGYYFSLRGYEFVDHGNGIISECYSVFGNGECSCILPCERQSKKRYETAKAQMDDLVNECLANWCDRHGITITDYDYQQTESQR